MKYILYFENNKFVKPKIVYDILTSVINKISSQHNLEFLSFTVFDKV